MGGGEGGGRAGDLHAVLRDFSSLGILADKYIYMGSKNEKVKRARKCGKLTPPTAVSRYSRSLANFASTE